MSAISAPSNFAIIIQAIFKQVKQNLLEHNQPRFWLVTSTQDKFTAPNFCVSEALILCVSLIFGLRSKALKY